VADFSLRLYDAVFGAGTTPGDDAALARIAGSCGVRAADFLAALDAPGTARRHDETIAEALAAGVFGVPSFVVNGELFWGNDRLVLLRHHLRGG
jgi:2-hydroxychromene-2-carboxylate isomerase